MTNIKTIATTKSGWKAKTFFIGKAKDWIIENEDKKGVMSAGTEITQDKESVKNFISNYNINNDSKKVVIL